MYAESAVIYADILFLINFSLDYLCLFITSRLLNCSGSALRMSIAAGLGGIYSFLPYLFSVKTYISLPLHLIAAAVICFIAFGSLTPKRFIIIWGTFIVSSALFGGLITGIYSLSSQYSNGIYGEVDAVSFCIICAFSVLAVLSYGLLSRRKIHTHSAEIRIYISGEKFSARLLADSGNLVTEPFSALPVIILSSSALPPPYDDPESEWFPLQVRAIPFQTSAGRSCFFGFRPDRIEIIKLGSKPKRADAYIAVDTAGHTYSGYDGLIPTSII